MNDSAKAWSHVETENLNPQLVYLWRSKRLFSMPRLAAWDKLNVIRCRYRKINVHVLLGWTFLYKASSFRSGQISLPLCLSVGTLHPFGRQKLTAFKSHVHDDVLGSLPEFAADSSAAVDLQRWTKGSIRSGMYHTVNQRKSLSELACALWRVWGWDGAGILVVDFSALRSQFSPCLSCMSKFCRFQFSAMCYIISAHISSSCWNLEFSPILSLLINA